MRWAFLAAALAACAGGGGGDGKRLDDTATVPPPEPIPIEPAAVDFGKVLPGAFAVRTVTVTNPDDEVVAVDVSIWGGAFNLVGDPPETLGAGEVVELELRYAPASDDDHGWLRVDAEGLPEAEAELSGRWAEAYIDVPERIDFGTVEPDDRPSRWLSIGNTGPDPLRLDGGELSDDHFVVSGVSFPVELAAGEAVDLQVTFLPDREVRYGDTLWITGSFVGGGVGVELFGAAERDAT